MSTEMIPRPQGGGVMNDRRQWGHGYPILRNYQTTLIMNLQGLSLNVLPNIDDFAQEPIKSIHPHSTVSLARYMLDCISRLDFGFNIPLRHVKFLFH